MLWLPLCCPCSPCARVQWQTGRFRLRCSRELRSRVVVAAVAFEPVAAPVRQAHVVPCEWITAARYRDDLVDLGTQRVWCAQCFVDWLPADRAHIICGEHPFAQLFPAPAVAVSGIGAHDGSPWLVVYAQRLIYPTLPCQTDCDRGPGRVSRLLRFAGTPTLGPVRRPTLGRVPSTHGPEPRRIGRNGASPASACT